MGSLRLNVCIVRQKRRVAVPWGEYKPTAGKERWPTFAT